MSPPDASPGPLLESYSQPGSGLRRFHTHAMGTENVLLLGGSRDDLLEQGAEEAFATLHRLEQQLSKFLPDSDVSLVNTLAADRPVEVGEELLEILERSREAWELTGGAFDPTVGPLLEAWGLVDMKGRVPGEAEIGRLLELRGMDQVVVDGRMGTVHFSRPGVSIDLGAVGKGYIADVVTSGLRNRGITRGAFLSGRSTVVTWGMPPGEDRWHVDIVHPSVPGESLCELRMEPGALSTSGAYERGFRRGTRHYGHVLDPRTGYPVHAVSGVTVWTRSALLGDILSTTLFVLGTEAVDGRLVDRLARAWSTEEEPRSSVLLAADDPGSWEGLSTQTYHVGRPGFVLE